MTKDSLVKTLAVKSGYWAEITGSTIKQITGQITLHPADLREDSRSHCSRQAAERLLIPEEVFRQRTIGESRGVLKKQAAC